MQPSWDATSPQWDRRTDGFRRITSRWKSKNKNTTGIDLFEFLEKLYVGE